MNHFDFRPAATALRVVGGVSGALQIVDGGSASATCPQVSFDASLTITKSCTSGLEVQNGKLVVVVHHGDGVQCAACSGGAFPEAIGNVSVTDTPSFEGGQSISARWRWASARTTRPMYYPNALTGGSPNAGDQTFEDTAAVQGTGQITGSAKVNTVTASCQLCPPHQ